MTLSKTLALTHQKFFPNLFIRKTRNYTFYIAFTYTDGVFLPQKVKIYTMFLTSDMYNSVQFSLCSCFDYSQFRHEIFLGNLKRKEEILLESGKSLEKILDGDCHIREFPFLFEFQVSKLSGLARIFFFSQTLISHMTKLRLNIFSSLLNYLMNGRTRFPKCLLRCLDIC